MVWSGGALEGALVRGRNHARPGPLTPSQAESWRLLADEWAGDGEAQAAWRAGEAARAGAQPAAADLARAFAAGEFTLDALRERFDHARAGRGQRSGCAGPRGRCSSTVR
jgi:hypothetical protein